MSDREVLERAIQIAIDGGWTLYAGAGASYAVQDAFNFGRVECIIFNRDFAMALWGTQSEALDYIDGIYVDGDGEDSAAPVYVRCYEKHLMQMVIADDPVKYLGENLPGAES
ncbi:hypothetical protein [Rhodococcus sp. NPDC004095]